MPVLFFATQFLPYYHAGGGPLPSLGSYFWQPDANTQTTEFLSLFYASFRANDLIAALLGTQFIALVLIIITLILKDRGVVALILGCWGVYGIYTFLTTRSLTFSPVLVYGGIASLLMLTVFFVSVVISAVFFLLMYKNYSKAVAVLRKSGQMEESPQI